MHHTSKALDPRLLRHINTNSHSQELGVLESRADGSSWCMPRLMLAAGHTSHVVNQICLLLRHGWCRGKGRH